MAFSDADLARFLDGAGVPHEILRTEAETPTVPAAAEALGVPADAIVKSLLFADRDAPGRFVLVLARGLSRVDAAKLARARPGRWRLGTAEECLDVTGYEAGTVPPVGHATRLPVVVDAAVHAMEEVIGGGGTRHAMVRLARRDLEALVAAEVHDVARAA